MGKTSLKVPKIWSNVYSSATNMKKVSNLKSGDSLATFWTHVGYKFGFPSELKISEGGVKSIFSNLDQGLSWPVQEVQHDWLKNIFPNVASLKIHGPARSIFFLIWIPDKAGNS
jgi:hypothetical protein